VRLGIACAFVALAAAACSKGSTPGESSSATPPASVSVTSTTSSNAAPTQSAVPVSRWDDPDASVAVELVSTPGRVAWITFEARKGGYIFHRGERSKRLPREWFGAGPGRHDLSLSADGARLAVPMSDTSPAEMMAVMVFETETQKVLGRFAVPQKESPGGGGFEGKISADGKYVVWTFTRRACMVTEIETGTLDVDGAKHKKCVGS
jgi:hypothetical protein